MLWVAGLGSAISIKLCSSIDDVVWLAPFLTSRTSMRYRLQNAAIYTSICIVQTITAMIIAYCGDSIVSWLTGNDENAWSTDKILTVGAGIMLSLYSVKLVGEYVQEEADGEEEKEPQEACSRNDSGLSSTQDAKAEDSGDEIAVCDIESAKKPFKVTSRTISKQEDNVSRDAQHYDPDRFERERQRTLFVIAYIGSVDDLTLFVPMLVGKGFDLAQLLVGACVAASAIVSICLFLGQCKPVADLLSNIPLFAIVIAFAITLLGKGLMMA
eukprot:TRINITY_DN24908_c0_g1_i1.p1 TRINITY_DN24908_c0_g1~~TRINITY_DN24908_c0_g1_i1.p1  ORF type:complete len:270 (+),score=41.57 TRINITY_DN24908_c0_g1_i1:130-939(+)